VSAHTPGPWRWEINQKSKELRLCGGVPRFDLNVLDFQRWGMSGAVARFRGEDEIMHHALDFAEAFPGREHHANWCSALNHPDARLIAAAPELLAVAERVGCQDVGSCGVGEPDGLCFVCAVIAKAVPK